MLGFMKKLRNFWTHGSGRTIFAVFCAHSVSISIGICQAYSAILLPQLNQSTIINITDEQGSWLASLGAVTNPVGSILSGLLAEYLGRRISIVIGCVPFALGFLCIALASNIWTLYIGRLITGVAAGMSPACYTYVAEVSTPSNRGTLLSLGPAMGSLGILLTYTLGAFIEWNTVALISISFSILSISVIQFVPESPSYLFRKGKSEESIKSLNWLRRNETVAKEEYARFSETTMEKNKDVNKSIYLSAASIKPFLILVTLFLLQEVSGIYTILFYAVNFFQDSNLDVDEHIVSIILGGVRLIMSIVTAGLLNKYGRKPLLMISSFGMAVSMLLAVIYFKYYEMNPDTPKVMEILPVICVLLNVVFSMVGMLPIPWILVGEMLPLRVRSIMGALVVSLAQIFIFICVKIYHTMIVYLNFSGTLFVFCFASILSFIFCNIFILETKNKSLEEIEEYFCKDKKSDVESEEKFEKIKY